jgi:ubiquinone/menaquinone biosynthesis C-methylase UbiE
MIEYAALPSFELARLQCAWLRGARSRLLRSAGIHKARRILDLGCGWGLTTFEISERCDATVIGVDRSEQAIEFARSQLPKLAVSKVAFLLADSTCVPLEAASIDIIITQCSLMWMPDPITVLLECNRLLVPGGRVVAIEPDYGGLMEWPASITSRDIWLSALTTAGADPLMGRKLPLLLEQAGFQVSSYMLDRYEPASCEYLLFLIEIIEDAVQRKALEHIRTELERLRPGQFIVHLPFWMQVATKDEG